MNKAQLIDAVAQILADEAEKTDSKAPSKAAIVKVTNALVEAVQGAVAAGDTVQISGFGTWERRFREGGERRNPQGGTVLVEAKHVPAFRPGSIFKDTVAAA